MSKRYKDSRGLCSRTLREIIMSSIKAPPWKKVAEATRRKGWNKITFSAGALCALIRAASDGLLQEEPLCFLYSLREKDLLSATYITVLLHYVLQLTCVKKKRMRSAWRRGRTLAALNGTGLTRQTLSEHILLCALLYLFIYFSLECASALRELVRLITERRSLELLRRNAWVLQTEGRKRRSEENKRHAALMTWRHEVEKHLLSYFGVFVSVCVSVNNNKPHTHICSQTTTERDGNISSPKNICCLFQPWNKIKWNCDSLSQFWHFFSILQLFYTVPYFVISQFWHFFSILQ